MPLIGEQKRDYQRRWLKARRDAWLKEHGPCVDCGSWENLQVDHIDPKQKVSHRVWSWSQQRRDEELSKCVVRCQSDHQKKTTAESYPVREHGTITMYDNGKCRCMLCRKVSAEYKRKWRIKAGKH